MKIICFAYNKKIEYRFFTKIAPHLKASLKIVLVNKEYKVAPKALKALKDANLKEAIAFKVAFEKASVSTPKKTLFAKIQKWRITLTAHYLYLKYYTILSKEKEAQYLMLWSGLTFRQAIAKEAAKACHITPIFIENGLLPNTIVMDKKGVNFQNSLPRTKDFYQHYTKKHLSLPTKLIPRSPKKKEKFSEKKEDYTLPKRYIFVPFQVDYDTQIILNSPWISNMPTLFEIFSQIVQEPGLQDLHIVFKEHPSSLIDYPKLHQKAKKHPRLHIINSLPTQTLIEHATAVATINSTVGIESLLLQKRVIVLGNAFYAIDGICKQATSKENLIEILHSLSHWHFDKELVGNFLSYLYYDYLIPGNFLEENPAQYEKIDQLLTST